MPPGTTKQSRNKARREQKRRAFLFDHHSDQPGRLYHNFGKYSHERRIQLGLTQDTVAAQASISRGYLSQIEAGQRQISLHIAVKLATILQFSIDDLLDME